MPLAVDPRIEALLAAARGRVASTNAQRNRLAILAALGLTDSGLLERSGARLQSTSGAGFAGAPELANETYGVNVGPEGRAFRQGRYNISAGAAARGAGFGSATENANTQLTRDLKGQVDQAIRAFDAAQQGSFVDQTAGLDELARGIADVRFEQGREQAARREVDPEPVPGSPPSAAPGAGGLRIFRNPGAGSLRILKKKGAKLAGPRYGKNVYVLPGG